ncbi:MAG TPA: T9SS type A sorting domain-containing protein [Bacteroidia bacterium]|jgi:hypothetical protein|nr:T9SS type A sorting domain-containing protein [Bacteroidia bacterium]
MKKNLLAIMLLSGYVMTAQTQDARLNAVLDLQKHVAGDATLSEMRYVQCSGTIDVPSADLNWRPLLSHKFEEHEPAMQVDAEKLAAAKARVRADYQARMKAEALENNNRVMANTYVPIVGTSYSSNKNDQSTPQDNNIAISNHGIIVSVSNSTLEVDDSTGKNLYYQQIATLLGSSSLNVCDPVVLYDKGADRFIFYSQECSGASSGSMLEICFSKTNNPATGGWNYYKLSGNPLNDGSWCDYPKIGITDNELFISSNLFSNSGNYNQSVLWQIGKSVGYAGSGGTLSYKVWSNIAGSPFTLLPLSDGQGNSYGPAEWVVCTSSFGASTFDVYKISGLIGSNPTMTHSTVNTTAYAPVGNDLPQKGSTVKLSSGNDCRTMSGFYLNGTAHVVFQCDFGGGTNAINYSRINLSAMTCTSKLFGSSSTNYSFPAVASFATGINDPSVMIVGGHTDGTMYPEIVVVNCDPGMNFSVATSVKASTSYVNFISSGGSERWGDYSGMCRKHNSLTPSVWCQGSVGNSSHAWDSWNAEIHMPLATGIADQPKTMTSFRAYPNPVLDIFRVEFSVEKNVNVAIALFDLQGRVVKELYSGPCMEGENTFSFNKTNLSPGTYFLNVKTADNQIRNEKIVIAD